MGDDLKEIKEKLGIDKISDSQVTLGTYSVESSPTEIILKFEEDRVKSIFISRRYPLYEKEIYGDLLK